MNVLLESIPVISIILMGEGEFFKTLFFCLLVSSRGNTKRFLLVARAVANRTYSLLSNEYSLWLEISNRYFRIHLVTGYFRYCMYSHLSLPLINEYLFTFRICVWFGSFAYVSGSYIIRYLHRNQISQFRMRTGFVYNSDFLLLHRTRIRIGFGINREFSYGF
jgi:hypothetical protein